VIDTVVFILYVDIYLSILTFIAPLILYLTS